MFAVVTSANAMMTRIKSLAFADVTGIDVMPTGVDTSLPGVCACASDPSFSLLFSSTLVSFYKLHKSTWFRMGKDGKGWERIG